MEFSRVLIQEAKKTGKPEYESLMKEYAKRITAKEAVAKDIGKEPSKFIKRVAKEGSEEALEKLEKLDLVTGTQFSKRAKAAGEARQLGKATKEGFEIPFFPTGGKFAFGHPLASKGVAITGLASPKMLPKIINVLQRVERSVAKSGIKDGVATYPGWLRSLAKIPKDITIEGFKKSPIFNVMANLTPNQLKTLDKLTTAYEKNPKPKFETAIINLVGRSKNGQH